MLQVFAGWLAYSGIFALAAVALAHVRSFWEGTFTGNLLSLLVDFGQGFLQALVLSVTGFIVFAFLKYGLGTIRWMNHSSTGRIARVGMLYVLCTLSMVVTFAIATKALPLEVMVDLPILNTATILVFAAIPYFRDGLLGEQE